MPAGDLPLSGCRVLVLEDDYWVATQLKKWLREAGAEVVGPFPDVALALQALEDGSLPDVAVLDVNLGRGEFSYPVADKLAEMKVPYLFASGEANLSDVSDYASRPRLWKPFGHRKLVEMVAGLLVGCSRRVAA